VTMVAMIVMVAVMVMVFSFGIRKHPEVVLEGL